MKRHVWLARLPIIGMLLALAALGPWARVASASGTYYYDFERGLKPWQAGMGSLLTWDQSDNLCPMELGTGMALVTAPVKAPDRYGMDYAYMTATYAAGPADTVIVEWSAKPGPICLGDCMPVVAVGTTSNPASYQWATPIGQKGVNGWIHYSYKTAAPATPALATELYVALGVSQPYHPLKPMAVGLDCVRVSIIANSN